MSEEETGGFVVPQNNTSNDENNSIVFKDNSDDEGASINIPEDNDNFGYNQDNAFPSNVLGDTSKIVIGTPRTEPIKEETRGEFNFSVPKEEKVGFKINIPEQPQQEAKKEKPLSNKWIIFPIFTHLAKKHNFELIIENESNLKLVDGSALKGVDENGKVAYIDKDDNPTIYPFSLAVYDRFPSSDKIYEDITKELMQRNRLRLEKASKEIEIIDNEIKEKEKPLEKEDKEKYENQKQLINKQYDEITYEPRELKITVAHHLGLYTKLLDDEMKVSMGTPKVIGGSEKFSEEIKALAKQLVVEGRIMEHFIKSVSKYHFNDDEVKQQVLIAFLSMYVEKSINVSLTGESTSGKSSCAFKCIYAFPRTNVLIVSGTSEKALYYYCKDNPKALKNKLVYMDEANPNMYGMIKSLTNPDSVETPYLTIIDGEVVSLNVEKPLVMIISSVLALQEQEMKNRFINPEGNSDKKSKDEADDKILKAGMDNKLWRADKIKDDTDYQICRCAIEYLVTNYKINGGLIPEDFFSDLKEFVQSMNRSDIITFLTVCKTIAFLNIAKRKLTANNEVIVEKEDIDIAKGIWGSTGVKLSTTEKNILELFERESDPNTDDSGNVKGWIDYSYLSLSQIYQYIKEIYAPKISRKTVERSVASLVDKGLVDKHGEGQGITSKYCIAGYKPSEVIKEGIKPEHIKVHEEYTKNLQKKFSSSEIKDSPNAFNIPEQLKVST